MYLNTIKPAEGSRPNKTRVGRGIGCTKGKTCGRGHKGQHSRSGGFHKVGFEGGQMPLQRRIPKFGFSSRISRKVDEVRLHELAQLDVAEIDLLALKQAGIVSQEILKVKIILSGSIEKPVVIKGLKATAGARAAIEAAGGRIEE